MAGADGIRDRLGRAARATEAVLHGDDPGVVPAYAPGDDRAGMFIEMPYYAQAERGAVPSWRNEMTELSWAHWLTFDGLAAGPQVEIPVLLVHSDGCVFPDNVRALAQQLRGPVEVAWGEGEQIDFYDQPPQTAFAVDAIDGYFRRTLGATEQMRRY